MYAKANSNPSTGARLGGMEAKPYITATLHPLDHCFLMPTTRRNSTNRCWVGWDEYIGSISPVDTLISN